MKKILRDYLALALDGLQEMHQIQSMVEQTREFCGTYKIGLELFTRFGPAVLEAIKKADRNIFLDLKFHDIPNTVAKAVHSASHHGVHLCTIHTQGGKAMMSAAVEAGRCSREIGLAPPRLIGVTVLTSIDEQSLRLELNVDRPVADHVLHLSEMALASGMDGIVCSAADLPYVKARLRGVPENFEIITPGIRSLGSAKHDQKRTATPAEALALGATILVIGREATSAKNPAQVLQTILYELRVP